MSVRISAAAAVPEHWAEFLKLVRERTKKLAVSRGAKPCPVIHSETANCPVCFGLGLVVEVVN